MDEPRKPVGHGVILQSALAFLAIIAAVFDSYRDKGGQPPVRVFGDSEVIERVADQA